MNARRFELLKDLPNEYMRDDYYNAKKGDVFVWSEWHKWYHREYGIGWAAPFLKKDYVENSPDIFKEVVDKEWEIVKGKNQITGEIHKWIDKLDEDHISNCINSNCIIHSVKRLSDGEVFSVGDEVNWGIIEKFDFENNELVAVMPPLVSSRKNEPYPYNKTRRKIKDLQKLRPAAPTFQWTEYNQAIDDIVSFIGEWYKTKGDSNYYHIANDDIIPKIKLLKKVNSTPAGTANGVLNTEDKKETEKVSPSDVVDRFYEEVEKQRKSQPLTPQAVKLNIAENYEKWLNEFDWRRKEAFKSWKDFMPEGIDERIKNQPPNNKERIEVKGFNRHNFGWVSSYDADGKEIPAKNSGWSEYSLLLSRPITESKLPAVKQDIEQVLNDEPQTAYVNLNVLHNQILYTEEDLKKAFEAAREKITADGGILKVSALKFSNSQDYINSLHK